MKLKPNITQLLKKAQQSPIPQNIEPMLATLVSEPVTEKGWLYEMKWDGYRALAYMNGSVELRSRNDKSTAYSLRPKPGATVSMPLHWEEVKPGLKMKDFTMLNAIDRLKNEGDIFKGVLGKGINMAKAEKQIQKLFGEEVMKKGY